MQPILEYILKYYSSNSLGLVLYLYSWRFDCCMCDIYLNTNQIKNYQKKLCYDFKNFVERRVQRPTGAPTLTTATASC